MHQVSWTYTQAVDSPQSTWTLDNVPEGAKGPFITHVQDSNGILHTPTHQELNSDGHLEINFGMTELSGVAYGNYYLEHVPDGHHTHDDEDDAPVDSGGGSSTTVDTEGSGRTVIESDGNVVNITVHQHGNGPAQSQS